MPTLLDILDDPRYWILSCPEVEGYSDDDNNSDCKNDNAAMVE